jgi:hypothetical protein
MTAYTDSEIEGVFQELNLETEEQREALRFSQPFAGVHSEARVEVVSRFEPGCSTRSNA